jgi:hypothetical protein
VEIASILRLHEGLIGLNAKSKVRRKLLLNITIMHRLLFFASLLIWC